MIRIYKFLTVAILILTHLVAEANPVEKINTIKRDPAFIYGEATKSTQTEAYDAALNILQANIQLWYASQKGDKVTRTLRNLTFLADTINAMRGDFHRVFAYVSIEKVGETVMNDVQNEATARKGGSSRTPQDMGALHHDANTAKTLGELLEKKNFQDFVSLVSKAQKEGVLSSASRDITRQPDDSYLAIFGKTKKEFSLLYLLAPGTGKRTDLISGQQLDTDLFEQDRASYRFLWFVPSITSQQQ